MDTRFPRSARVRVRAEFDRIFTDGRRVADPLLSLHWLHDDIPPRLGLAVSRKVDPRAVGRNRIKRILREQFRALRDVLAPGSYVAVARQSARTAEPQALRAALIALLRRSGALPASGAPGTMPGRSPSPSSPQSAAPSRRSSPPAR